MTNTITVFDTLYKRTSTGAVQIWYRELDGNKYRSVSGQIDGQKVTSEWTVCEGKNIGRSNETTGEEQAEMECESAYTKKLAQGGYHEKLEDIDKPKFFKPMLAKDYHKDFPGFDGNTVYSQPKLDGVRCIATKDGLWTRQGKPLVATPHISVALENFFERFPDAILDGELYADKLSDDFGELISLVRKVNPTEARLAEAAEKISLHVYDYPSVDGSFADRISALTKLVAQLKKDCIKLVPTSRVVNQGELDFHSAQYLAEGYEGQIVRISNAKYENKRSKQLLKRKQFVDREFTIVEIVEGQGNRTGIAGFITYELGDGRTFRSGIKGNYEYCRQLLADAKKYVGGQGTVKYFELTPDGVPRFPVTIAVYEGQRDI